MVEHKSLCWSEITVRHVVRHLSGLARWQLRRVLEFLEAHLTEDIGLDELAQLVGLSQSQFARAFKVSTGASGLSMVSPQSSAESTRNAIEQERLSRRHRDTERSCRSMPFTKRFVVSQVQPRRIGNEFIGAKADNLATDDAHFSNATQQGITADHRDSTEVGIWERSLPKNALVANHLCQMFMPPEASMRCPLTQRLSSESNDAIIGPMSSG